MLHRVSAGTGRSTLERTSIAPKLYLPSGWRGTRGESLRPCGSGAPDAAAGGVSCQPALKVTSCPNPVMPGLVPCALDVSGVGPVEGCIVGVAYGVGAIGSGGWRGSATAVQAGRRRGWRGRKRQRRRSEGWRSAPGSGREGLAIRDGVLGEACDQAVSVPPRPRPLRVAGGQTVHVQRRLEALEGQLDLPAQAMQGPDLLCRARLGGPRRQQRDLIGAGQIGAGQRAGSSVRCWLRRLRWAARRAASRAACGLGRITSRSARGPQRKGTARGSNRPRARRTWTG